MDSGITATANYTSVYLVVGCLHVTSGLGEEIDGELDPSCVFPLGSDLEWDLVGVLIGV